MSCWSAPETFRVAPAVVIAVAGDTDTLSYVSQIQPRAAAHQGAGRVHEPRSILPFASRGECRARGESRERREERGESREQRAESREQRSESQSIAMLVAATNAISERE
jgi:hypothetical protein